MAAGHLGYRGGKAALNAAWLELDGDESGAVTFDELDSSPQPYQLVRLMINQDFGWQPAGRLTRVSTSIGTSWRPAHLSFVISNPRFITRFITRFSPRS